MTQVLKQECGEPAQPLVCYVKDSIREGEIPSFLPSPPIAGKRVVLNGVKSARELVLPLICCSSQESRPWVTQLS